MQLKSIGRGLYININRPVRLCYQKNTNDAVGFDIVIRNLFIYDANGDLRKCEVHIPRAKIGGNDFWIPECGEVELLDFQVQMLVDNLSCLSMQ